MPWWPRLELKLVWGLTVLLAVMLIAAMLVTTPDNTGPFGITLWFVGLLFTLGGLLTIGFYYFRRQFGRPATKADILAGSLRSGVLLSTWLVALLALNSLRQLGLKDIVLVSILVGLINFYLGRTR